MLRLFALLLVASTAPAAEHVVLVSIDGFSAYHLLNQELELENIRGLIRDGAWADASETVFPSVTHPSHTTMVTGVYPLVHGVLSNGLRNRETGERFHPTNKKRTEIVKVRTLFDEVKAQKGATAAFFCPKPARTRRSTSTYRRSSRPSARRTLRPSTRKFWKSCARPTCRSTSTSAGTARFASRPAT